MQLTRVGVAVVTGVALVGVAACGGGDTGGGGSSSSAAGGGKSSSAPSKPAPSKPSGGASSSSKPPAGSATGAQFGSACKSVPKSGPGSFQGMSTAPVATAVKKNPDLTTLTRAVGTAGLTGTLNKSKNITVFAPNDDAFQKLPKQQRSKLMGNKKQLATLLRGHVVKQPIGPGQLSKGKFTSLAGTTITTSGKKPNVTVSDTAKVGCGNIKTANATVYIIDHVLMPKPQKQPK